MIHPDARCSPDQIGPGSSIGAGSIIDPGVSIGSETAVGNNVTIEGPSTIANAVTIQAGTRILTNTVIADDVKIGANAVVGSQDGNEVSRDHTVVGDSAVIGAGAVVGAGLRVGSGSVIHSGAVVSTDVPAHAIVAGNPAWIQGYANAPARRSLISASHQMGAPVTPLGVEGCELWELPSFRDLRGSLVPLEHSEDLPFIPARTFFVFDVPGEEVRGEHAHRLCAQFLIAIHGSMSVVVDDSVEATEVQLDRPSIGLLIPAGVWGVQYRFREDGVLAVLASHPYEADDYIRDYDEFLEFAQTSRHNGR